jgi:uncharacterized NAD-dependent epimerase/dehydratase family protein
MNETAKYALYVGDAEDILDIKTANGFYHWRKNDCVGEISLPGCKVSTGLPKMGLAEAWKRGARKLIIGVTPHGGQLRSEDIPVVQEALALNYTVISGLHAKLADVPGIRGHAAFAADRVIELRHGGATVIGTGEKRAGKRLLTVGTDCCVGKMFTSLSLRDAMEKRGVPCTFRATGQTGIMIAEEGVCVDAVVADFVAGNVEMLSKDNRPDHWDVIEGQGSLFHPAYANVSLALLHGSQPDVLVVCHEWGRKSMDGTRSFPVPSLRETIELNLVFARMTNPAAKVAGISMNTRRVDPETAKRVCLETESQLGLPCMDAVRDGVDAMLKNIL